ncbi:hypothetical protein SBA3_1810013 [Candidatus Sulfopaludibacter sp. SbA3]|nr:hypothetical protein SBA3_1810013 [Candidatus Sulfopaludibacter sp. SbA3]
MPLVSFSLRVHAILVAVYPVEFRRRFGREMNTIFRNQMLAATKAGEWWETLLIWKHELQDVILVGLPLRLADSLTIAAILSASITPLVFISLIWSLENSLAIRSLFRRALGI